MGFLEEPLERAREAHVEPGPQLPRTGDDVAGESFARRCRSLGYDVELCSVVGGSLAVEKPGVGATVDRFVIDYRELANLEWFGQWTVPLAHRIGTGQLDKPLAHPSKGVPRQRRGKSLYHRLLAWKQPERVTRIGETPSSGGRSPRFLARIRAANSCPGGNHRRPRCGASGLSRVGSSGIGSGEGRLTSLRASVSVPGTAGWCGAPGTTSPARMHDSMVLSPLARPEAKGLSPGNPGAAVIRVPLYWGVQAARPAARRALWIQNAPLFNRCVLIGTAAPCAIRTTGGARVESPSAHYGNRRLFRPVPMPHGDCH